MNLKIPKIPRIAKTWNTSGMGMRKPGLGNETQMMKKFFMYRNMFGNGFGALPGAPMQAGMPNDNIGGIHAFSAARKMGMI